MATRTSSPHDAQLATWLATVDVNSFKVGIHVEALGIVLLVPFAAWLYSHLRKGARDSSWLPVATCWPPPPAMSSSRYP